MYTTIDTQPVILFRWLSVVWLDCSNIRLYRDARSTKHTIQHQLNAHTTLRHSSLHVKVYKLYIFTCFVLTLKIIRCTHNIAIMYYRLCTLPSCRLNITVECCSFIQQSVLRQVQSLFQSELSTQCDLELPLSNESIISFPYGHPVASYVFFFVFLSLLTPLLSFLQ